MISNNLAYTDEDDHQTVRWCINLQAIQENIETLCGFEYSDYKYTGPAFFINGSLSVKHPLEVYTDEFPNAKVHYVDGAAHYVFMDKAKTTAKLLSECLQQIK